MKNTSLTRILFVALSCTFVLFSCVKTMAQQSDSISKSDQVNKLFESAITNHFPGASVIIIRQGKILLNKGYGLANIEQNSPNTPVTVFRLGSVTKQFTAMAILQLYDKGMLQINDYIEKYFPGTLNGNKITIKQLLTHTSGISESLDSKLAFTPGDQISYSNTGYNLLGKIIEKVSGLSYEEYLQKNIFIPLGMKNSGFEHPNSNVMNRATGYKTSAGGSYENAVVSDISGAFAAGALYSTAEDMYKWDQALYTEKLVRTETLNQAFTPATLNDGSTIKYGFGWMVNQWRGLREIGHGGDITGFNTYIARFPDQQFTVIVLSNIEMRPPGPIPDAGTLAHSIAEIYLSDKISKNKDHVAIQIDSKILDNYAGQYKWLNASAGWIEASGESCDIIIKNNQLYLQSKAGEIDVYAEGEDNFFTKDNSTVKFTRDKDKVTGMVIDAMGLGVVVVKAQKIK